MSERCYRCWRPYSEARECLCPYIKEIECGIKFVFLMHPKEFRHQRTGTGHLAHISLVRSELFVGLEFDKCAPFIRLLKDGAYYPVLLYPEDGAHPAMTVKSEELRAALSSAGGGRELLVIVIDATWFCSRKVIEHNPFLLELPRLSFAGSYCTQYRFKREPKAQCISTIESCYYLIKEAQAAGLADAKADAEPLMAVFRRMVQNQIDAQNERVAGLRPNTHAYDWKYAKRFEEG